MLCRRVLALQLPLCFVNGRQQIGPAARLQPFDIRFEAPPNSADPGQWSDDEGAHVEADDADEVIIVKLAHHPFGCLLGVKDSIVLAHAPRFVDDQDDSAVFFFTLWRLFRLHWQEIFDRCSAVCVGREARFVTEHQKTIAGGDMPFHTG
jgi:hypothetical protein